MEQNQFKNLKSVATNLYETQASELPFDKRFEIKSFVLQRPEGNLVIYHSPKLNDAMSDIEQLGGISKVLMNHDHESLGGTPEFNAPFYIHEDDARALDNNIEISGYFSEREKINDDLLVIPTPGHTPGTTMFIWENGEHRFLFTGDFLCVDDGELRTVILGSSDRESSIKSLEMIRELDFDVIVPWVSIKDEDSLFFLKDDEDKTARIQEIIDRVRNGENE